MLHPPSKSPVVKTAFVLLLVMAGVFMAPHCYSADPFSKRLSLKGVTFVVSSLNKSVGNEVTIRPSGLPGTNVPISKKIDGVVTDAVLLDLNNDGLPEIYVFIKSANESEFGSVIAYGTNGRQSVMKEIAFGHIADEPVVMKGYLGHDAFSIKNGTLVRRFPIYAEKNGKQSPTGKFRQIQYTLKSGAKGWELVPSKASIE